MEANVAEEGLTYDDPVVLGDQGELGAQTDYGLSAPFSAAASGLTSSPPIGTT